MQIIDLFSGIGGFSLAGDWMGWKTICFCEIDKFCTKVLNNHWSGVPVFDDIYTLTYEKIKNETRYDPSEPTIIVGGFPCQPFSNAGKRKGTADNRYLWPEMLRVISEVKPQWVIGENVAGLLSMDDGKVFDRILSDLEAEGYEVEPYLIPACGVGAWHRRNRVWITAHSRLQRPTKHEKQTARTEQYSEDVPNTNNQRLQGSQKTGDTESQGTKCDEQPAGCYQSGEYWATEPNVGRVAHGVPNRVDRLKSLGNAIVPQIAFQLFSAINKVMEIK